MPMGTVYKALLKADMLGEEQEKKEENEDGEGQYCQYHKRSMLLHSRLSRVFWVGTRNDERGEDKVL